ncbi:SNF2 domain-containing protein CLASSY 4-like [Andrographis paniculata]|uniref:SNF2 domain-containing protein CLASSY 4-like n=1 Tax=Andrographis paniculata TaxID=175694 RepID=UPI0021E83938|nr:SNF2 domain-containing protein CLASSY 4-like [Andrographis paniculata]
MDNRQSVSNEGEGRASLPKDTQNEQQLVVYTPSGQDEPSTYNGTGKQLRRGRGRTQAHSWSRDNILSPESAMEMHDGAIVGRDETIDSPSWVEGNDQRELASPTLRIGSVPPSKITPEMVEIPPGDIGRILAADMKFERKVSLVHMSLGLLDRDEVTHNYPTPPMVDRVEPARDVPQLEAAPVVTEETRNNIAAMTEHLFGDSEMAERDHDLDTTGCDDQPEMDDDLPVTSGFDEKVDEELVAAQNDRCADENHNLSYMGSRGLICTSCGHVELDAYQVLSSRVDKIYFDSSEEEDEEGTQNENERKVAAKKGSMRKMQPSEEEFEEILEHLRNQAHTHAQARIFGDECSVPELVYDSSQDNSDSASSSNTMAPLDEIADINVAGIGIGIGGQVRSTRRINTHLSSIYVLDGLSGDEDFTLRKRRKVKNEKRRVDTAEAVEEDASGQRKIATPKRKGKAAVNSPQRRLSEMCADDEHRLEPAAGGVSVSVSKAKRSKAPQTSRNSGGADDMPYWLQEMTKFMTGAKAKKTKPKRFDISKFLQESFLRPPSRTMHTGEGSGAANGAVDYPDLPKKFRFEDDVVPPTPTEEEQREAEVAMEVDDLIDELNFNCAAEQVGTITSCEVVHLDEEEDTQERRCARGLHVLTLEDNQGLYCTYCQHVAIHPRDVIPPWAIKGHRAPGKKKKKQDKGEGLDLSAVSLAVADAADVSSWSSGSVWSITAGVRETMYQHQQEGFEFLWKNLAGSTDIAELKNSNIPGVGGCIISHAPGTGKTRLTIVFLEAYLKMFPNCLPIIIVPANILGTWEAELRRWNAGFNFHNLNNPAFIGDERAAADHLFPGVRITCRDLEAIRMVKIYTWKRGGGLLGISYNLFEKLTGHKEVEANAGEEEGQRTVAEHNLGVLRSTLRELPGLAILDEGHTPRNSRSKLWASLVQLKTEKRVILSGTPFQNSFQELFNTLKIVRPTVAESFMQDRTFAEILQSDKRRQSSRPALLPQAIDRAVERLKVSMSQFVHVYKGTVLQENLPGLRDCVILLKPTGLQKILIDKLEGERSSRAINNEFGYSLVSTHPYLVQKCKSQVPTDEIDMKAVEASKLSPGQGVKTKFILEFVRLCMHLDEKVLIFSQYIPPLELIKEYLTVKFDLHLGKEILKLDGKLDKKQRQKVINAFNDPDNDSKIMLASIRCCSEGISLVGASRVILLDVVWNPSVEQQAICRAYRIGQKKFVHSYHLMTAGTAEADKYCRQAEKERISELVFCSSSNEKAVSKQPMAGIEDRILEEMVQHAMTEDMFEKIIHQPKNADLIQSLGVRA